MIGELMPDKFELTLSYARISFIFYEKLMSFLDAAIEYRLGDFSSSFSFTFVVSMFCVADACSAYTLLFTVCR